MAGKTLVQLGRLGDIINILPVLQETARMGRRATLCVAEQFAPLLDGISYADKLVFRGDYSDLDGAVSRLKARDIEHVVSQVWAKGLQHHRTSESFARDSYQKIGWGHRFEQGAVIFDRRNPEREASLAAQVDWSKPVVLMSLGGHSAPYRAGPTLFARVQGLLPECNVVDLSALQSTHFFDLLGVFDRAQALVTIDTGTLHLAKAAAVPVVALVAHEPWLASPRSSNHLIRRTYLEVDAEEVAEAVRRTMCPVRKLVHVWSDWEMSPEDRARNENSRASWLREYKKGRWKERRVHYLAELPRDSQQALEDKKPVPFVRDMLEIGMQDTRHDDDVVVLTNSDVGFVPGITEKLSRLVAAKGSAFCYRFDHEADKARGREIHHLENVAGEWHGGLDLFAFSRRWLKQHFAKLPDMVMGRTHWDLVYRDIVRRTGGGDLYGGIWHEKHGSFWVQQPDTAGNRHNLALAADYNSKHDTTRPWREEWR